MPGSGIWKLGACVVLPRQYIIRTDSLVERTDAAENNIAPWVSYTRELSASAHAYIVSAVFYLVRQPLCNVRYT